MSLYACRHHAAFVIAAGLMIGFSWTAWQAASTLGWELPHELEGKPLILAATVYSLPVSDKFGTHFTAFVDSSTDQNNKPKGHAYVRLTWVGAKKLRVGDSYQLTLRLKRIHGLRNPGGFDYEAWAMQNGLRASGSVLQHYPQKFLGHRKLFAPVNQVRQILYDRITASLPSSPTAPWLLALMIGERSSAPPQHWLILRATGTNHLMAIAGLHIGLIAGMIHFLIRRIWSRSSLLVSLYPSQLASALAALVVAWIYSALAGFSIPTQRACIMLTFFMFALLARRALPAWHAWSAALLTVLLFNPHSVLSESFWLSFGTIALIIFGMQARLSPQGLWWKWFRVQWVIGFGLIPFSLLFFQQASLISAAANSIAIPWLGFLILPFCMLSTIFLFMSPALGEFFLYLADKSLVGLWKILEWFAQLDYAVWTQAIPSHWLLMSTMLACLILLMPVGAPGRWVGLIWFMPIILYQPLALSPNEFRVTTLDVGQGLSVIVETSHHALIFDAGPTFGSKFDTGESVVLPYLYSAGITRIDKMIISHGDNDHIGGAWAVIRAFKIDAILTSAVEKFPAGRAATCLAGTTWQWDGVRFEILYPTLDVMRLGNDSSCVLRISNNRHSILLTGDIEKFAESQLLQTSGINLHASMLTAPHHGSKTSSQHAFIQAVAPEYVIFATGYRNRYHFPHLSVVRDYQKEGVIMLNTVNAGAIQFYMRNNKRDIEISKYRIHNQHYWNDV